MSELARAMLDVVEGNRFISLGEDLALKVDYLRQKRVFDLAFSALALVLCVPLFLLVAVAVKLTSRGPVFFRQPRVGLDGREFMLTKFRSMVDGAHRQRDDLAIFNDLRGPLFKMRRDPRLTLIGRFLRKTSLDELPQLWHVLGGEMSVVGPRPHATYEVEQYVREHADRFRVKPGLTCLWQVQGRNLLDFEKSIELDYEYIRRMSWATDLRILAKTVPVVLGGRGAM
jgi:lipopolysaccharide/colanic/teichoic acid biosynthesis glycosyltransferase